jgi:hypothetical protein
VVTPGWDTPGGRRRRRSDGVGAVLAAVYALFAVAAGARSLYQLTTKFDDAPFAYVLSAVAAVVYLGAAVAFSRPSRLSYRIAVAALLVELVGVLAVGTLSLARPEDFPDQTVWSDFGSGYGFIPLVLPVAGLLWLARGRTRAGFGDGDAPPGTDPDTRRPADRG